MGLKHAVLAVATQDAVIPLWRPLVRGTVTVLTLHRFADPDYGIAGVSIPELRANLAFLRRNRLRLASLPDLIAGPPPNSAPSVVFTVDDGYAEFARVAAPVFAEFDCPVTVFLVTGAIDNASWLWWDRVEFAFETTKRTGVELDVGGRVLRLQWDSVAERRDAIGSFTELAKTLRNDHKESVITSLIDRLDVDIPARATPRYAAMSWNDLRECAKRGVTFGPHSVTHPILPSVGDEQAEWEILESWRRLRAESTATVPIFSYPNGAFSHREVAILAASDLVGAVTMEPRYASHQAFRATDPETRFCLPRFAYLGDRARLAQVVGGLERLNMGLRNGRAGWAQRGT